MFGESKRAATQPVEGKPLSEAKDCNMKRTYITHESRAWGWMYFDCRRCDGYIMEDYYR